MKTNFDLGFSSALVLRTPAYSYEDYKPDAIPLHDPYFRTAILIASPVLYRQLEKKEFNPEIFNDREKQTLLKYWNRACFRPTPFGLFAGVSYVTWGSENKTIILSEDKKLHTLLSYEQSALLAEQWLTTLDDEQHYYTVNGSLYTVGREYRHLQFQKDGKTGDRKFIINAVEQTKALQKVLRFLKEKRTKKDLQLFVQRLFEASEVESRDYIAQLIAQQIITSVWLPNITGEDYLQRLARTGLNNNTQNQLLRSSVEFAKSVAVQENIAGSLQKLDDIHANSLYRATEKSPFYVITEHRLWGALSEKYQDQIKTAIECSALLNKVVKPESLKTFTRAFAKKYDQQWVPLMEALDPEVGVGYMELGASHNRPILLEGIEFDTPEGKEHSMEWTAAHKLLMNKITQNNSHNTVIHLTDKEIGQLKSNQGQFTAPPSIAVMFRLVEDQLYLEQAGGASALGLIGRFTIVSTDLCQLAKDIAGQEQSANPDVVFAELIYIAEQHAANIDRREVIYPYEIPLSSTSTQPEEQQIQLSDLWISVAGDEVILWSERLQKRIIPHLSSAYNYQRSSLPVFRFLGDLQHQGIHSNLSFDLSDMFPGLDYYPRVEFQNTILSLEMWRLSKERINSIISLANEALQLKALAVLCKALALPCMVTINEHDHQLAVNINEPAGIKLLLDQMKSNKELLLKEFPFTQTPSVVTDAEKRPYAHQLVAALYNREPVYKTQLSHFPVLSAKTPRKFMPGSKWLYLKMYCHPYRSNELLTQYLLPCIHSLGKQVKQYFFIRYKDSGYHIRLRLQIDPAKGTPLIQAFRKKLEPLLNDGLISGFNTDVYIRELERYTTEIIDQVEDFFCAGSALVLDHLLSEVNGESDVSYYQLAVSSMEQIMDGFNLALEKRERICHFHYQSLFKELGVRDKSVAQFKLKYRELKEAGLFIEDNISAYLRLPHLAKSYPAFEVSVKQLNRSIAHWHLTRKIQLLSDLIHMHLNRLFVDQSREQEMVIYYCMSAFYYSKHQRQENVVNASF